MQMQKAKTALSIAIIFVSLGYIAFYFFGPMPKVDPRPHIGIGNVLAEQAAQALGSGGKITLIAPDTSVFRWPGPEVQLKAFHRALAKANLTVALTNRVKLDPGRVVRVNAEDFLNLLRKQSEADVIVSLLGPPLPTAEQKAKLSGKHARVIAVCSGDMPKQVNLHALFEDNLLYTAIISRPAPPLSSPQSDDPGVWFKHLYQVIGKNSPDVLTPGANP